MQVVSLRDGALQTVSAASIAAGTNTFRTGIESMDAICPRNGWRSGVHELLADPGHMLMPLLLMRRATEQGFVVWSDPRGELYLPAVAALGARLDRLIILRPEDPREELWAINECLRCKGVAACVASLNHLSQLEARRLQLSAEHGGGLGILMRPLQAIKQPYAAATRWVIRSYPGERTVHRWKARLVHGHGGRVGESVVLEVSRDTNHVRASKAMADRPATPAAAAATA